MAPHSSTLAWKVPWTEEPGGLQSMGSLRVGHDWATSLSLFTFMHWRRKWQPTPVFLPGESQGWGSPWAAIYGVAQSRTRLKWLSSDLMDWETDCWRAQTEPCVHQDPGERSSDPTRDWPRLACECPGVSGGGVGRQWPAAGLGTLSVAVCAWALLNEVAIIFNAATIVWPQVKQQRGNTALPINKIWLKIYWAWPIRTRPSFPLSLSHQEASISLLSFSSRGQIEWKPQSQKTKQSDHMNHSLV